MLVIVRVDLFRIKQRWPRDCTLRTPCMGKYFARSSRTARECDSIFKFEREFDSSSFHARGTILTPLYHRFPLRITHSSPRDCVINPDTSRHCVNRTTTRQCHLANNSMNDENNRSRISTRLDDYIALSSSLISGTLSSGRQYHRYLTNHTECLPYRFLRSAVHVRSSYLCVYRRWRMARNDCYNSLVSPVKSMAKIHRRKFSIRTRLVKIRDKISAKLTKRIFQ